MMRAADLVKFLAPMRRRISLMVERAVVSVVNDALKMQGLQIGVLADEVRDNVERYQEYGFTSNPHPGAEAIVVALGGTRNRAVVVAVDDRRYRLKGLAPGEVALYTDEGDKIHFKRGRVIEVIAGTELKVTAPLVTIAAATKVRMETPLVEITGALVVTGNITGAEVRDQAGAKSMSGMRNVYSTHTHNDPQGGVTGGPNQPM
jgi:phage baseplate assembly protein V